MAVLTLFLDGVGIGTPDPAVNPLAAARMPELRALLDGAVPTAAHPAPAGSRTVVVPLDATLGVDGLPQSGTGQTAIFTGENGARLIGKHFGPWPYSTLRPVIGEKNVLRTLLRHGCSVRFANVFPQRFFDHLERRPTRATVTVLSATSSGVPLLRAEALEAGEGISADITAEAWPGMGYAGVRPVTPREAGRRLAGLLRTHDFVLFEYWKTDHAGHSGDFAEAVDALGRFDGLLGGVVEGMDPDRDLVLLCSDHGNVEDMSVKTHTRNPVPLLLHGRRAAEAAAFLGNGAAGQADLTRVTPLILHLLGATAGASAVS